MDNYIIESMAQVGCGVSDTKQIAKLVESLPGKAQSVLDTWYNFGQNLELKDEYKQTADWLKTEYDSDTITCLSAYINAKRNITSN